MMASNNDELSIADFERRFDELVREAERLAANHGSYNCQGCSACKSCMFCRGCDHCFRCNYCVDCEGCSQCTRCERCSDCHSCSYCIESERCTGSAFLVRCVDCADSTYCFGCVGLVKKDFHILNEPYDRTTYFELIAKLKKGLRLK